VTGGETSGPSQTRQAVMYCPYCAEETLFPIEGGGWECRSCLRAFSVKFLGLVQTGQPDRQGAS
jgi:ribosomal protein L37AE/L43A